jgi:hypothetical protein
MNAKPLNQARDEDARHVEAALRRAAQRARQIAAQTQTRIVVVRNGRVIKEAVTTALHSKPGNDPAPMAP